MLERVLGLALVVPNQIGIPSHLARLVVETLLDSVDVADVVLPCALGWAPFLPGTLSACCGCIRGLWLYGRLSSLALCASLGLWSALDPLEVGLEYFDGALAAFVSMDAWATSWGQRTDLTLAPMCDPWDRHSLPT